MFKDQVLKVVKSIPPGKTLTYREVAKRAGNENAYRAVGNILKANQDESIPCHRVIRADGKLGSYNGLLGDKRKLLESEGAI